MVWEFPRMQMQVNTVFTLLIKRFVIHITVVWLLMYTHMITDRILLTEGFLALIATILMSCGISLLLHPHNV
jgi:hypothetical protein